VKFWFNPLTARFEVKDSTVSGNSNVIVLNCDSSLVVGDLVIHSLVSPNSVEKCINNTSISPCIGIVESKPTPTTCIVMQFGVHNGFGGLTQGKHVFVDVTGIPTTGYLQVIGVATSATQILINVQALRIQRA
jgi:hypothetical protein